MKKIVFTGGGRLDTLPSIFVNARSSSKMAGKSTISGTRVVLNTKKSSSQAWMSPSIPLQLGNCVAISLCKICWTSSKLVGNCPIALYHVTSSSTGPFFKGRLCLCTAVIAARVSGVPVFIHESDLSMGLANKIAYKFATKMYSTFEQASSLSKVEHVGSSDQGFRPKNPEPDELVDIQTHFNTKLPTILFVGGSAGARVFNQLVTDHKKRTDRALQYYQSNWRL